jgi:PEP-CTERM motif
MKLAIRVLFVLALCLPVMANAQNLINNGGFELGNLSGWTVNNANGPGQSGGVFASNTTTSPLSGEHNVGAASGNWFALTDQGGPGVHAFSQDFTVGGGLTTVSFDMFVNDFDGGPFCGPGLNINSGNVECGRVDVLTAGSGAFDTGAGVVANLYDGADAPNGTSHPYINYTFNLNLAAGSYTLRFGEADNQSFFNMGVDNVSVTNTPEPGSLALMGSGLIGLAGAVRRKLVR